MWFNFLQPLSVGSRTDLSFSLYLSPVQWHKSPIPLWCTETSFVEQQGSIGWDCVFVISSLDHIPTKQTYQRFHNRRNEALSIIFVYNQLTPSLQSSKIREFASEYLKCSLLLLEQSRFYYTLLYIAHPNFSLPIPWKNKAHYTQNFTIKVLDLIVCYDDSAMLYLQPDQVEENPTFWYFPSWNYLMGGVSSYSTVSFLLTTNH